MSERQSYVIYNTQAISDFSEISWLISTKGTMIMRSCDISKQKILILEMPSVRKFAFWYSCKKSGTKEWIGFFGCSKISSLKISTYYGWQTDLDRGSLLIGSRFSIWYRLPSYTYRKRRQPLGFEYIIIIISTCICWVKLYQNLFPKKKFSSNIPNRLTSNIIIVLTQSASSFPQHYYYHSKLKQSAKVLSLSQNYLRIIFSKTK